MLTVLTKVKLQKQLNEIEHKMFR